MKFCLKYYFKHFFLLSFFALYTVKSFFFYASFSWVSPCLLASYWTVSDLYSSVVWMNGIKFKVRLCERVLLQNHDGVSSVQLPLPDTGLDKTT